MQFSHLTSSALDRQLGTDDATQLFTTARRKDAINEAVTEFNDLTECFIKESTVTCSNGVATYDLGSTVNIPDDDYIRLPKRRPVFVKTSTSGTVTYRSGEDFLERDLTWLNQNEPHWQESTGGTPNAFYLKENGATISFGLYPPPQIGTGESAKVILPYLPQIPPMTSSTDVPFSGRADLVPLHQGLVHYAAAQLEMLRPDPQASQTQMQYFLAYVQRFTGNVRKKGGHIIAAAVNYFGNARRGSWMDVDKPRWYR